MKYKLYMVLIAGMWLSMTTKGNVALVLQLCHSMTCFCVQLIKGPQFNLYEDDFCWSVTDSVTKPWSRPPDTITTPAPQLASSTRTLQHRWDKKCDKSGLSPEPRCFIDPFNPPAERMIQGTKSGGSSLTKPADRWRNTRSLKCRGGVWPGIG